MNKTNCDCLEAISYIKNNNLEAANKIIKQCDCCQCSDNEGNTLLHYIAKCKDPLTESILLELLQKPNIKLIINEQNKKGETPVFVAVNNGNAKIANLIDNAGGDIHIPDFRGNVIEVDSDSSDSNNDNVKDIKIDIHKLFIPNDDVELPTLNLNLDTQSIIETSDNFIEEFRNKLHNLIKNNKNSSKIDNKTSDNEEMNTDNFINGLQKKYKKGKYILKLFQKMIQVLIQMN